MEAPRFHRLFLPASLQYLDVLARGDRTPFDLRPDRPIPFPCPVWIPNGVIQIAQHGSVILRNSTIGVDDRFPLRVWWNNNPGYGQLACRLAGRPQNRLKLARVRFQGVVTAPVLMAWNMCLSGYPSDFDLKIGILLECGFPFVDAAHIGEARAFA